MRCSRARHCWQGLAVREDAEKRSVISSSYRYSSGYCFACHAMKLATLNALIAAVEDGSLRSAARRVGLSQPALTKTIRELEVELGAQLLQRSSRGVTPTPQGKLLYEHAIKATRELGTAVNTIRQMSGQMVGEVHIGAVPLAVMLLIPETLRTFGQEFPQIRLRVSEELYVEPLHSLRSEEVDVTVGGIPSDLPPGEFTVERLLHTTMVPTVRKDSQWLKAKELRDLQDARWVLTGSNGESGYARLMFEKHGLRPPVVGAVVNSTLALLSLVISSDCIALMPEQIARGALASQYISVIPIREQGIELEVGAIMRSNAVLSPVLRQLTTHLHRAAHHVQKDLPPA